VFDRRPLTLRTGAKLEYRPTVMFVYHPCDDAMLSVLSSRARLAASQQ
jgi:homospermidine synthase